MKEIKEMKSAEQKRREAAVIKDHENGEKMAVLVKKMDDWSLVDCISKLKMGIFSEDFEVKLHFEAVNRFDDGIYAVILEIE